MAKISSSKRLENKEKFDDIVISCFFEHGWDYITLNNMAKEFGIGKSSVQSYYPTKSDFANALRGKVFPVMMENLAFESPEKFKASWEMALEQDKFRMVVHLLVSNAAKDNTSSMTLAGIERLSALLTAQWGSNELANDTLYWVLGASVAFLATCQANKPEG